jgi:hypothetical protein
MVKLGDKFDFLIKDDGSDFSSASVVGENRCYLFLSKDNTSQVRSSL